ncbi:MAG: amino acid permease [Candidatus Azobacteroides pseudotrichonymphae]|jgi:APA family basic amino acid/polyamine antiporter|uniref:Amino acid transporter n=1 Tax=Azobacteroides pseudotrichonymphae genomovar. CFP2 TaxID=511995 RepID=B6YRR2_AZOPC|nr:amino acid permease [Candidatus Azobacteroides pseudotrichonymphae]BAG83884.1 putative amino acid transporter [Candidatus Azobacteroides pseudotrichonymphae genomovar. CFP2]GMO33076.1 MAG: amino acid permease [Candidatus Azobacteroides pseudotrichonymphae]
MSIFKTKPISVLLSEAKQEGENTLKKTFGPFSLIALGLGAIIGAGLFSIVGIAAGNYAGPSIIISFLIAAVGCCFAGLCYAEFASMLPVAGSAYTYSYATLGEFGAWIIGWNLVLEYAVGVLTISISWSRYFVKFLEQLSIHVPSEWTIGPWEGGIINLPAALIIVLISFLLTRGTESSSKINNVIVFLKVAVVLAFIILGWRFINYENYVPFIPKNEGKWGEFGFSGIIHAAALIFFAYVGFDAVSTAAQETKNPQRDMPIGIMGSLILCAILYILFSFVIVGVTNYTKFQGKDGIAPVKVAIDQMGTFQWLNYAIIPSILIGFVSVILVMLLGQSRVFYSMSRDGLLPQLFSDIHPKYHTPYKSNVLCMMVVSICALFVPARITSELSSIGTLTIFIIVCFGILIMRKKMPDVHRTFRTPWVPFIPILGIFTCLSMMFFLSFETWILLILWTLIGYDIYVFYGFNHSRWGAKNKKSFNTLSVIGVSFSILLLALTIARQYQIEWKQTKIVVSWVISLFHIIMYISFFFKEKDDCKL